MVENTIIENTVTKNQKISDELLEKMDEVAASDFKDEKIPVCIWYEYIGAKRDVSKDMIGEKYEEVFADYEISDSDIIFKSQCAPMVIVELAKYNFEELTQNEKIVSFELFEDTNENQNPPEESRWNTLANCLEINGFSKMKETTGLTGSGVTLGMLDHDTPFEYSGSDMDKTKIEVLEAVDANAIQQHIVKIITFTESQKYLADVNNDGVVNVLDANKTLNRVVGLE